MTIRKYFLLGTSEYSIRKVIFTKLKRPFMRARANVILVTSIENIFDLISAIINTYYKYKNALNIIKTKLKEV